MAAKKKSVVKSKTKKTDLKIHSYDVAVFLYNIYRQQSILKEGQKDE